MEITRKPKAECCPYKCHQTIVVQVPAQDDTQTMDVNDQQVADTNVDDDQQAASEDEEGALAAAIRRGNFGFGVALASQWGYRL